MHYGIFAHDHTTFNNTFYNNKVINSPYALNSHNKIIGARPINTR
jgi:hypothetical protein